MLAEHKGSITVSAVVGTGLVTLGVALTGMAGLSNDLQAANRTVSPTTPAPLLAPGDEVSEPARAVHRSHHFRADCKDRQGSRDAATGTTRPREL